MSHTAGFEIKGPEQGSVKPKSQRGEVFESSGELDLSCAICRREIGVLETVVVWPGTSPVAHLDCLNPRQPLRAPFIAGGEL